MPERYILEICTGDPRGVIAAMEGGADRIELCSGLSEGGLTPSPAMMAYSSERLATNVLIRPRAGDFVYTEEELQVMERDIEEAMKAGASGIVTGVLTPEGEVDITACRRLLSKAAGHENTFHRAFDIVREPFRALEDIIASGFSRLLTSGCRATAEEGAEYISELNRRAKGRIKIIAASGVSPENVVRIIRTSGVKEVHASARTMHPSAMPAAGNVRMGSGDSADGSRLATDKNMVAALRFAIDSI